MGHVEWQSQQPYAFPQSQFSTDYLPIKKNRPFTVMEEPQDLSHYDEESAQDMLHTLQSNLMQAALNRDGSTMQHHLQHVLDRNDTALLNEINALHWAAYCGDAFLMCRLLGMGCDILQEDNLNHETPIYFAVKGVNFNIVKLLVEFGGVGILNHKNRTHLSPFLTAAADFPEDRIREMLCIIEWFYLQGISLEEQDDNGQTALFWSAKKGNTNLMQWLLSHGASMTHRDFMGNSVLHVACSSGNEEAILFLCENGAIKLLDAQSIEDERYVGNTVFGICQVKRYFFLYMSLWKWALQYRWFGFVRIFKTAYAWYYWVLAFINLALFLNIFLSSSKGLGLAWAHFIWICLWVATQILWSLAFTTNPGCATEDSIIPQFDRISCNFYEDIAKPPVYPHFRNTSIGKLQILEREQLEVNAFLIKLNKQNLGRMISSSNQRLYKEQMEKLMRIRAEMNSISNDVALERRKELPKEYVHHIMQSSSPAENICVTCKIVKPVRVHHCSSCARCIHRQDHHCVWIDNCIGGNNQRSFWLFLLCVASSVIWNYYVLLKHYTSFASSPAQLVWLFIAITFGGLINAISFWFVLYLLGRTTRSMITNVTCYEQLKRPEHIKRRFNGEVNSLCWDLKDFTLERAARNIIGFWNLSWSLDDEYIDPEKHASRKPAAAETSAVYSDTHYSYFPLQGYAAASPRLPPRGAHEIPGSHPPMPYSNLVEFT